MRDVLVVGAGPAGAIAAWRLASAGARVTIVDRDAFPRDKLCGDTLNPGAVGFLESLRVPHSPLPAARPLAGMTVSGPRTRIDARYPPGVTGRAILRRHFDAWLLNQAVAAGAQMESGLIARGAVADRADAADVVRGITMGRGSSSEFRLAASVTIAADGRASRVARSMGLARHPSAPRRWAFGTYMRGVAGTGDVGEMHVRGRRYIGIAPIADGVCNVCVVTGPHPGGKSPKDVVTAHIQRDPQLRQRFAGAALEGPIRVLGPLAVESPACGLPGLLLAGDAAGFIDPMTGDGLHLALRGGWLAAGEAMYALETGDLAGAVSRLTRARAEAFNAKLRFNRWLRRLVEAPVAVELAGLGGAMAPGIVRWAVTRAGDVA
jgi:flavin-dependent dehydrogenase